MNPRKFTTHPARLTRTLLAGGMALALLSACGNSDSAQTAADSTSAAANASATAASATAAAEAAPSETRWHVSPTVEMPLIDLSAERTTDLHPGDTITVRLANLNPKAGYYTAICLAEQPGDEIVPICTGGRGDATAQAWIKPSGGTVTLNEDGTADFELAVAATGKDIDCNVDACVLKVFGDHSQGFTLGAELPVTFAK